MCAGQWGALQYYYSRHNVAIPNTTQHNTTQHNTTQHNTTQHNTTQHNTTQHNTTQHNTTRHYYNYILLPYKPLHTNLQFFNIRLFSVQYILKHLKHKPHYIMTQIIQRRWRTVGWFDTCFKDLTSM